MFHDKMLNILYKINTFIDQTCSSININMFPNNVFTLLFFTSFFFLLVLSMSVFSPDFPDFVDDDIFEYGVGGLCLKYIYIRTF